MTLAGNYSTPATAPTALYTLITQTGVAGWTKPKDSDGTTYSASGAQVTSGASGSNGLANNSAWFILREPSGVREWCFQRGTTNLVWRVKVSPTGFSGGSPTATQVPSATDEAVLFGGGTDASPTFATLFAADGSQRCLIGADNASGYAWFLKTFDTGGSAIRTCIAHDPHLSGSYPAGDTEPVVYRCAYQASTGCCFAGTTTGNVNGGNSDTYTASSGQMMKRFTSASTGGANWRPVSSGGVRYGNTATLGDGSGAISASQYASGEARYMMPYGRTSATQGGPCGYSSLYSVGSILTSRLSGDILIDGSVRVVRADALWCAWDTTEVAL